VPPGTARRVVVDGIEIALCNVGGELYAVDDVCTHAWASLSEGVLVGAQLECPLHGGCFDVRTGAADGGIVTEDLRRFAVRVDGAEVSVSLSGD
jgi:nitrite reductase/ring-hydroxylating ferredoxin subunit